MSEQIPLVNDAGKAINDNEKILKIPEEIGCEDVLVISSERLGDESNQGRPIKVILKDPNKRLTVLQNAQKLKHFIGSI